MKKYLVLLALITGFSAISQENYSKVKIYASDAELAVIYSLGVTIDHGHHKPDMWFTTDLSESDIQTLADNGFIYEVLIEDVSAYYVTRNEEDVANYKGDERAACSNNTGSSGFNPVTPTNFQTGSMAGFYTYQEYLDELDSMASKYPSLITPRTPISTDTLTWEGRPLYWCRISDNPNTNETNEPEVLYTAIHHAREPLSLTQLIYYMWYMLENYGTNDEVTYLVDNTEMYFVPMINPDGYVYNVVNDPSGGGMHRKNRNPSVGTSNVGVDLNRNYSYHWNETGTSPNQNNDTYAGSGPFSEPETQLMKTFCEQHEFKFAFNNHTHGDELLHPIGWSNSEFAPDHNYFQAYSGHMATYSGWANIKSSDLYPAAGDSDDWAYIDDIATKDTIFAMTPEIGDDFWPSSTTIIPTCNEMMFPNLILAHLPHIYGFSTDLEPNQVTNTTGYFSYEIERLGLQNGDITVSMTPLAGIQSMGGSNVHSLSIMDVEEDSISYVLNPGISFGDEIKYILHTDNGTWVKNDTITKSFGNGTAIFLDDCSNLDNWSGSWSFTNEDYVSPSNCITDSPFTNYSNNTDSEIELNQTFDFTGASYAYVSFNAKWEIENNWDYVEFMISTDGGSNWSPLCGNYTNQGGTNQDFDEPLYDGFQSDWVLEQIDLTDYIGMNNCKFKFYLFADGGVREDGYYFDDFGVYTDAGVEGVNEFNSDNISVFPNPTNNSVNINLGAVENTNLVQIYNDLGQLVYAETPTNSNMKINVANWNEGIYIVKIIGDNNDVITKRFTVIK